MKELTLIFPSFALFLVFLGLFTVLIIHPTFPAKYCHLCSTDRNAFRSSTPK